MPRSVRVVRIPLATDRSPTDVLRLARGDLRPFALLGAWAGGGALVGSDPLVVVADPADPFEFLDAQPEVTGPLEGAVGGGWVGYLGYRLGELLERLPPTPERPVEVAREEVGFYDHLIRYEATSGQWWFEALWSDDRARRLEDRLERWRRRLGSGPPERAGYRLGEFASRPGPEGHLASVARAIEHIRSGDVFQVNVCWRLEASFEGDPAELFCTGAERLDPRYGAYVCHGTGAVASFSPELFLRREGRRVLTSPIKGTARRQPGDPGARDRLLGSEKDRAENLMIVDLMRNDLGRVCRYGSVVAPELFRAEGHPGVWHLVSDVAGELPGDVADSQLLRATFPPGSVTGAPKVRAMELVATLEATAREAYTGAIGIASPVSGLELNVAIRTFEVAGGRAWLGVGGGIVADSAAVRELEECRHKARPLLDAVGGRLAPAPVAPAGPAASRAVAGRPVAGHAPTSPGARDDPRARPDPGLGVFETLLVQAGRPMSLEWHLGRLAGSVAWLYGAELPARLGADLIELARSCIAPHRLRVLARVAAGGELETEVTLAAAPGAFCGRPGAPVALVPTPIAGGLGAHKWQDRRILERRRRELGLAPDDQLVVVDEDGTVLEAERASLFAVFGEQVRTPPLDGRILEGTTRGLLRAEAARVEIAVSEAPLALEELAVADEIFLTSAITGVLPAGLAGAWPRCAPGPVTERLAELLWKIWAPAAHPLTHPAAPVASRGSTT